MKTVLVVFDETRNQVIGVCSNLDSSLNFIKEWFEQCNEIQVKAHNSSKEEYSVSVEYYVLERCENRKAELFIEEFKIIEE